mgnify:FL=1
MSVEDDDGSILPLVLGYVLVALAVILVCVNATSLYIAQKQLDALADAAALAGADGFELVLVAAEPVARLSDDDVREQADALIAADPGAGTLSAAWTPDGVSARVTVTRTWHPVLFSLFVPDGVALESTATSRNALN